MTQHRESAEKLLDKIKVILESTVLPDELARDIIETELAITYIDGQQDQLRGMKQWI